MCGFCNFPFSIIKWAVCISNQGSNYFIHCTLVVGKLSLDDTAFFQLIFGSEIFGCIILWGLASRCRERARGRWSDIFIAGSSSRSFRPTIWQYWAAQFSTGNEVANDTEAIFGTLNHFALYITTAKHSLYLSRGWRVTLLSLKPHPLQGCGLIWLIDWYPQKGMQIHKYKHRGHWKRNYCPFRNFIQVETSK